MRGLAVTYNKVVFSPSFSSHEGLGVLLQELSLNMRRGLVLSPQERERGREGGREREREGEREVSKLASHQYAVEWNHPPISRTPLNN